MVQHSEVISQGRFDMSSAYSRVLLAGVRLRLFYCYVEIEFFHGGLCYASSSLMY
jgi:hypothetical protein